MTTCLNCAQHLQTFPKADDLHKVTSDSRPIKHPVTLALCPACGLVQKVLTPAYLRQCDDVYAAYALHTQSGGASQQILLQGGGLGSRDLATIQAIAPFLQGDVLDTGAGTGSFLRTCASARPDLRLHAFDIQDKHFDILRTIPGMQECYSGSLADIPKKFDAITLLHTLEHIPTLESFLHAIRNLLAPAGKVIILVPDSVRNPFDLMVFDHIVHFSQDTLQNVLTQNGFSVASNTIVFHKEILVVAGHADPASPNAKPAKPEHPAPVQDHVDFLHAMIRDAHQQLDTPGPCNPCGLFGSSIASSWLYGNLKASEKVAEKIANTIAFWVDEDPARHGNMHLGLPILGPDQVPHGATVFAPVVPSVYANITQRAGGWPWHLVLDYEQRCRCAGDKRKQ